MISLQNVGKLVIPFALGALLALSGVAASAQTIYQPASVTTDMGTSTDQAYDLNNLINQSGLQTPYVSGVTDLSTYNSSSQIFDYTNLWSSEADNPTGTVTFDLGNTRTISDLLFWNSRAGTPERLTGFSLAASDDSTFSSGVTNLGDFTVDSSGGFLSVRRDVFSFATTTARYFRMTITGNGGAFRTTISEVAFAGPSVAAAAPEPGTLGLLALGIGLPILMGNGGLRKRVLANRHTT